MYLLLSVELAVTRQLSVSSQSFLTCMALLPASDKVTDKHKCIDMSVLPLLTR